MQATLSAFSLKHLYKALTCLTKFGEDVHLQALDTELILSSLNSSKTAHAKFRFSHAFFSDYSVISSSKRGLTCHLNAKALLGIIRSRGVDRTVEKCQLELIDPDQTDPIQDEDETRKKRQKTGGDSSDEENTHKRQRREQARFVVKLFIQHGFIKTYNLHISTIQSIPNPVPPRLDPSKTSKFSITGKCITEWMEPFPTWIGTVSAPGSKEGFLAWAFSDEGVRISSWEGNIKADHLATEFFVDAEDFLEYYTPGETVTIGFPMREFKAITLTALSLSTPIFATFTAPFAPLAITLADSENVFEAEFMIMTQEVPGFGSRPSNRAKDDKRDKKRRSISIGARSETSTDSGLPLDGPVGDSQGKKPKLRLRSVAEGSEEGEAPSRSLRGSLAIRNLDSIESSIKDHRSQSIQNGGGDMAEEGHRDVDNEVFELLEAGIVDNGAVTSTTRFPFSSSSIPRRMHPSQYATSTPNLHAPTSNLPQEPLFYPGSQEISMPSTIPPPALSQLTQAQLEALGLGDLDDMDLDLDIETNEDGNGQLASEKKQGVSLSDEEKMDLESVEIPMGTAKGIMIPPTQRQALNPEKALRSFEDSDADDEDDKPIGASYQASQEV
ncbi:Checkpoint 9-1-1 complex, RAD9 component [Phaffia rhodozyma]|uniref:Checkpoint 9-1-1 complex, RAD9 component n=1 Tax=Phaffia rhodozyma TaxID=264483 RepID=A0A0F7SVT3_PHARH|nr:Checkpoint 9-1-1 complex, RAD9 component [Phaffia rhodozyma]